MSVYSWVSPIMAYDSKRGEKWEAPVALSTYRFEVLARGSNGLTRSRVTALLQELKMSVRMASFSLSRRAEHSSHIAFSFHMRLLRKVPRRQRDTLVLSANGGSGVFLVFLVFLFLCSFFSPPASTRVVQPSQKKRERTDSGGSPETRRQKQPSNSHESENP